MFFKTVCKLLVTWYCNTNHVSYDCDKIITTFMLLMTVCKLLETWYCNTNHVPYDCDKFLTTFMFLVTVFKLLLTWEHGFATQIMFLMSATKL